MVWSQTTNSQWPHEPLGMSLTFFILRGILPTMTTSELIAKLKRYDPDSEVCLLDHRCIEAFPYEISVVRKATKKEDDAGFFDRPVIIG
jgi:hypothetical protein